MRTYAPSAGWRQIPYPLNTPKEKALQVFDNVKKQKVPAGAYVELLEDGVVIDSFGTPPGQTSSSVYRMRALTNRGDWIEKTAPSKEQAMREMNAARADIRKVLHGEVVYLELQENGVVIDSVGTMPGTVTPPPPAPPEIPPTITPAPPTDIKLPVAPGTPTDELFNELVVPDDTVGPSTQEQAPPITYTPPPTAPNMFDDFLAWLESVTHLKLRQSTGGFRAPRPRGVLPKRAKALRPERDDDSLPPLEEYEYEDLSDDYVEPELYVDDSMSDYQEAVHQETEQGEPDVDYSLYGIVSNEQRPEPRYERMRMIRRKGE
jgi:hypothetical protein